jgi:hypothetical protein
LQLACWSAILQSKKSRGEIMPEMSLQAIVGLCQDLLEKVEGISSDLSQVKKALRVDQNQVSRSDQDQDQDPDPDLLRKEIIDQDLDPDLYDLGEAERSLKYYWKNRHKINNKREYMKKALAKYMKREMSAPGTVNFKTLGFRDDDLDPYLPLYTEDLRARVEDVNSDVRERLQGIDQLTFVAHKRLVLAGAKKAGILK